MNVSALTKTLAFPGLTEKEAAVYLASLELREPTPLSIAKVAGLPRPSVYRVLESLVEKGLMGDVVEGRKHVYVPEEPEAITKRLKLQASSIQNILPQLKELSTIYRNRPQIRHFEGKEGMKRICDDILSTDEKLLRAISSVENLFELIPDYFNAFVKRRVRKKMAVRVLAPKNPTALERKRRGGKEMRDVRFIPEKLLKEINDFDGLIHVYTDRVAFWSFSGDLSSVIIEDQELARVQRALFDIAWSVGEQQLS